MNDNGSPLYHGSSHAIKGELQPNLRNGNADQVHSRAVVFAAERADLAALFMLDPKENLFSIGFEEDIAYICIWGTAAEFSKKIHEGYLYALPRKTFEKIGKAYEWQSFQPVTPLEAEHFDSAIDGMMALGVQVYFINDDAVMDVIVADKDHRAPLLRMLVSENMKEGVNPKFFR